MLQRYVIWKESVYSDGQQFQQYQQNKQSPISSTHWTRHMTLEIHVLSYNGPGTNNVVELNRLTESS
jgi:hypothetical protein